jgi:hypothetical protein
MPPVKQTRELIEAELNASEEERVIQKLRNVAEGALELQKHLQVLEAEAGLPTFYRSKPLVERMAAVGCSQAAIDHVQTWFDAISKVGSWRGDELSDHVKREMAADADAELLGAERLANIVRNHRKP